jgi:hypothetical protein
MERMSEIKPRETFGGYQYAVLSISRAEGNEQVGTTWHQTALVPLDMPLREALTFLFKGAATWPHGTVAITVPETLPFTPSKDEPPK